MHFTQGQWETAYAWLCQQRRHHPAQSDVWDVRFHWQKEKTHIEQRLKNGSYHFSPLQCIQKQNGEFIHLWSSRDALVLKLLTLTLSLQLPIAPSCTHVKHHGGLKHTVCQVANNLPGFNFVIRTDVKAYYASIDHHLLIHQLARYIKDKDMLNLLWHYMNRMVERGGVYQEIQKGIARGCPLSPLIGAFFLTELDKSFERDNSLKQDKLFYVRYMDDILILTKTRWQCRRAVKKLNQHLQNLKLEKHPDKTFIGKIEKGFDFLGYHYSEKGVSVAEITWKKFIARWHRLYEQKKTQPERDALLDNYVRRWQRWTTAGLGEITLFEIASLKKPYPIAPVF